MMGRVGVRDSWRGSVKSCVEKVLVNSGICRFARYLRSGDRAILCYHNVIPEGRAAGGETSLHIREESFRSHLEALKDTHRFVSLKDLLSSDKGSPAEGIKTAITFDDAYRGALTVGVETARGYDIPVTVFVAPGLLGGSGFWWDILSSATDSGLDPDVRARALEDARGEAATVLDTFGDGDIQSMAMGLPEHLRPATRELLDRASEVPGVTVASHTWRHLDLTACSTETLLKELQHPHAWLADRYGQAYLPCLAYPYGRYNEHVVRIASRVYDWGFRVEGGLWTRNGLDSRFRLPRINVPDKLSSNGLLLRSSGLVAA